MMPSRRSGFTLIELSIVLIIIGLLAAGILVGRDLIHASEIRAQISQVEKYKTAVSAFRLKYNCLPGDCKEAVSLDLGTVNGNGNGYIESSVFGDIDGPEVQGLWEELSNAALIDGRYVSGSAVGVNSPALKLTGRGNGGNVTGGLWAAPFLEHFDGTTFLTMDAWMLTTTAQGNIDAGVYVPADTQAIDIKIDDGKPNTGAMRAGSGSFYVVCTIGLPPYMCSGIIANPGPNRCINMNTPDGVYNVKLTDPASLCVPVIKAGY